LLFGLLFELLELCDCGSFETYGSRVTEMIEGLKAHTFAFETAGIWDS
jgi:hypothetical protein